MNFTVISGTNRPASLSLKVSGIIRNLLAERGLHSELIDLCQLPQDIAFSYLDTGNSLGFAPYQAIVDKSTHFVFVAPEYNGSIPGILKIFIDACDYPGSFRGKSAALIGIAAGRNGNQAGIHHLQEILQYFGVNVYPGKIHLGRIRQRLLPEGGFSDQADEGQLREAVAGYLGHSGYGSLGSYTDVHSLEFRNT
ncbi:MAG: hypothetical protein RLZZ165_1374 [Bacteroidota bacterium]|jgi:NAD(P)H-dependent FMN reductase